MASIDDDKKLLIDFISTVRYILVTLVDKRIILFNEEASNLITFAWSDLQDDFQNIKIRIQKVDEQQLVKERLSGNSLRFKLALVKEILEKRDLLLLNDFKNSHIFGLVFRDGYFDYGPDTKQYSNVWTEVKRRRDNAKTPLERESFMDKLKKLIKRLLGVIEPLLESILGLAGIGSPIKEFKDSIRENFGGSSLY